MEAPTEEASPAAAEEAAAREAAAAAEDNEEEEEEPESGNGEYTATWIGLEGDLPGSGTLAALPLSPLRLPPATRPERSESRTGSDACALPRAGSKAEPAGAPLGRM